MFTDVIYTNITYFKLQVSVPLLFIKLSLFFFIELFSILHGSLTVEYQEKYLQVL